MGGKTQPRVAGNVKPASSGRIRELLINKHGAGNVITFKTLSSSTQRNEIQEEAVIAPSVDPKQVKQTSPTHSILSSNDKAALVVRKVGNRECFTRVRFTDNTKPPSPINLTASAAVDDTDVPTICQVDNPALRDSEVEERDEKELIRGEENSSDSRDEILGFETIMSKIRDMVHTRPRSLMNVEEKTSDEVAETVRLMKMLINHYKKDISIEDWDLINESLHCWIELVYKSQISLEQSDVHNKFFAQVLGFLSWLLILGKTYHQEEVDTESFPLIESLLEDWKNFYSSPMCRRLLVLHFQLATTVTSDSDVSRVFEALANIALDTEPSLIIADKEILGLLDSRLEFDSEIKLPNNTKFAEVDYKKYSGFNEITNLLKSNHRAIVVTAHAILRKLIDSVSSDSAVLTTLDESNDIENLVLLPPQALMTVLTSRDSIVSALLSDYRVGDISVTLDPDSDSYTCTLSYLFAWDIVIRFITGQDKEAAHLMIHCLKRMGLFQRVLDTVFMLLPPLGERDSLKFTFETSEGQTVNQPEGLSNFLKSALRTAAIRPVNEIELIALHVYFSMALHMPVTVRKWYNNNSSKRLTNLVNEYTVKHISQIICSIEMETIQEKCQDRESDENNEFKLVVKARPTAKEVYAMYTRDEFKMELTVKLPINYPLGPVQIDGGKRVGVTDQKWRSWLLQLTTFLSHQNGSILDGIDLWRRNIDKKFEGIEKCLICFSILHSNYQLPKKKCSTCTKMFHNLCLYKWFETSGNSTCPLCRNTW